MAEETEIIYQREADLPVASSPSSIGHLRAVDTDGASALASPEQLREMVGMDYSLLTEQVVPGEFFPYRDGTKRQVYVRTFIGTTPSPDNVYGVILRTMLYVIVVRCTGNINGMMAGSTMFRPSEKDKQCSTIAISNTGDYGIGEVAVTGTDRGGNPYPDGLPYSISIFYIKS